MFDLRVPLVIPHGAQRTPGAGHSGNQLILINLATAADVDVCEGVIAARPADSRQRFDDGLNHVSFARALDTADAQAQLPLAPGIDLGSAHERQLGGAAFAAQAHGRNNTMTVWFASSTNQMLPSLATVSPTGAP